MSDHLSRAVELALREHPHPNPRVGAVVVGSNGAVLGEGSHRGPGSAHAEVAALAAAGPSARGADLYVTLEPCNHTGRTGPCTESVIAAGIGRVFIGALDPNPTVSGGGLAALRAAGIEVIVEKGAPGTAADPAYFHFHRTGRSYVTLKAAVTLDGAMAAADGSSQWITGPEARRDGHRLRSEHDAVMVGAGTVRADDPQLTVRLDGYRGPQPRPVIVAGVEAIPADAALLQRSPIVAEAATDGRVALGTLVEDLGARGFLSVLVEGGPRLARSLWEEELIDRAVFYVAGRIAGGAGRPVFDGPFATMDQIRDVAIVDVQQLGSDLRVEIDVHGNR